MMVKPREMSMSDVLMDFANEHVNQQSADGTARIVRRALYVDGELLALHSRADNIYINQDHPNTEAQGKLRCFIPASNAIRRNRRQMIVTLAWIDHDLKYYLSEMPNEEVK